MIEFKGAYYQKGKCTPHAVLVQFDGVLLHVWHISDPFHRILTSDVFRMPSSFRQNGRQIRLPNGGRIESDDLSALGQLHKDTGSMNSVQAKIGPYRKILAVAFLCLLAGAGLVVSHTLIH